MTKLLVLSDDGVPSGYGRICSEILTRLHKRGYEILSASLMYDGLLPPVYEGQRLPYHVASLGGHPNWPDQMVSLTNVFQPDIIMVIQDAPYAETVRNGPYDWSRYGFVVITPVDGAPVYPQWVEMLKKADGTLSISQFGVDEHRKAGVSSELCRPGMNPNVFFRLPDDQRAAIREKLGIAPDAFVLGTVAMNQGRKDYPHMLEAFFRFATDKPTARYLINADPASPVGWDLNQLCQQNGWDTGKLIYKYQCEQRGVHELRDRYNVMDAHVVLAHREGFGLPLVEAQACGVVSMALDWCSGPEVCGDGYGMLIPCLKDEFGDYVSYSTWGGAYDKHPNRKAFVDALQFLHDHPAERAAIAQRGMERARTWTWDVSVDNVVKVLERVQTKRRALPVPQQPPLQVVQPLPQSVDGMRPVPVMEGVS
jgi:glycosyltransferase involved in cell wall biosynthesis